MYKHVTIIGTGSVGSFVSHSISQLDQIEKITLIDYDIILKKNLQNTIYKKKDIGRLKVDCLKEIIEKTNDDIEVNTINEKFIEGKTKLPECSLVLDCRDFTYNRYSGIDVRLYISSRYLILDCRKNIKYENKYKGKYISKLTKTDLRNVGLICSIFIENNKISEFIKFKSVNKFDLDYIKEQICGNNDILYDSEHNTNENKLINLPNNIPEILKTNKKHPINLFVGSKKNPIYEKQIPANLLKNSTDIISNLCTAVSVAPTFNTFIVSFQKQENNHIIELIPETGAA